MKTEYLVNTGKTKPNYEAAKHFYILPLLAITEETDNTRWLYIGWLNILLVKKLKQNGNGRRNTR